VRVGSFVKLKHESSTIILFVGIRYFMRELLCDFNNCVWPANPQYPSDTVNDVGPFSASNIESDDVTN